MLFAKLTKLTDLLAMQRKSGQRRSGKGVKDKLVICFFKLIVNVNRTNGTSEISTYKLTLEVSPSSLKNELEAKLNQLDGPGFVLYSPIAL